MLRINIPHKSFASLPNLPMTDEIDTATLRRLEAFQELHRCKTCGKKPRLQTSLATTWLTDGELEVTPVKSCDCP